MGRLVGDGVRGCMDQSGQVVMSVTARRDMETERWRGLWFSFV